MVKCRDCGFLSLMPNSGAIEWRLKPSELAEADRRYRNSAILREDIFNPEPICFVLAHDLEAEREKFRRASMAGQPVPNAYNDYSHTITYQEDQLKWQIYRERECDSFTKWRQGFSPKDHREMQDRQRLLDLQAKREDEWQKFQMQMAADDKKWREEQEVKAEERHKRELDTLRGIHWQQMLIMGGVVTLALVVGAMLGSAIEANWIPKWFGIG